MVEYTIERFIEESNRASSTEDVSRIFGNALSTLGYDRFCYSLLTDHRSLGLRAGHGIARNYPDDWMAHYTASGYEKKDPVCRHGLTASGPFTWDSLGQVRALEPEERKIMNEAREARLLDGIAIPIFGHSGELAGVGMASSTGGVCPDRNLLSKICALSIQFHMVHTELEEKDWTGDNSSADVQLTGREEEILLLVAAGKSDATIADIIGISHSTIRFHMNNIFKKLSANERTFATVKAIRLGLIVP